MNMKEKTSNKINTVAIYVRVSTEEQAREGYSISAQREKLKAYCVAQGWDNFKFYVDEGESAKDTNRTHLKEMIEHIKQGMISTVLVYRLDRLTRSVMDLYKLLEIFDQHDCAFKSATEVYDTTTAMGRMFITIVAALAQWERENLGERVRMGQIEKARQGEYAAKAPFGYDKNENHKLIINPHESEIVLDMIEKAEQGYSIRQLSSYLDGFVKPIRGYKWHIRTILDILSNHALYGAVRWREEIIECAHEGIITKERFTKLQKIISGRQNLKKRETSSIFIYQMKLVCPTCGGRLSCERTVYKRKKDNALVENNGYRCQACALNKRKALRVSEIKVEKSFLEYIQFIKFDEIPQIDETDQTQVELEKLNKQIATIERQRKKFQKAWSMDDMTDEEFSELMKETKVRLEEAKEKVSNIKPFKKTDQIDEETLKSIVNNIKANWSVLTQSEKKQFINMFIDRIDIDKIDGITQIKHIEFY